MQDPARNEDHNGGDKQSRPLTTLPSSQLGGNRFKCDRIEGPWRHHVSRLLRTGPLELPTPGTQDILGIIGDLLRGRGEYSRTIQVPERYTTQAREDITGVAG